MSEKIQINITQFPDTLDEIRYTEFNFYKSDLAKQLVDSIESASVTVTKTTIDVVQNVKSGDISDAAKAFGEGIVAVGGQLIKTGSSLLHDVTTELDKRINENNKANSRSFQEVSRSWVGSIDLPIPNNLKESLSHDWQENNGQISQLINKGVGADTIVGKVLDTLSQSTGTRNITTNPDYVQMYRGTKPRNVSFEWILMPNNVKEAKTIFNLIRKFKAYSSGHPSASYAFLTAPYFCEITIRNKVMNDSLKLTDMVINNVSVNYSESGYMEMFYDGTPKAITLSLELTERRTKTVKDWMNTSETQKYKQIMTAKKKELSSVRPRSE